MSDVARSAGVSAQTVSRVLSKPDLVQPVTKAKVLAAVAALGYRRNAAASALATRMSRRIGIIDSGSVLPAQFAMLTTIQMEASATGYFASLAVATEENERGVAIALDQLLSQNIEGLVVMGNPTALADAAREVAGELPVVILSSTATDDPPTMLHVGVDQGQGARLAVAHLADLGRERIGHVTGPIGWHDAFEREKGWMRELSSRSLVQLAPIPGDWTGASGYRAVAGLLESGVDAVFAANDGIALGVIYGLAERGVRVPEDVAVIGFDDLPDAAYYRPSLSTIRQDFRAVGQRTIRELVRAMNHQPARDHLVEPELVVRHSTVGSTTNQATFVPDGA